MIQPNEKQKVDVEYIPSSLNNLDHLEIHFLSDQIGRWRYNFSGIGVPPKRYDTRVISGTIESDITGTIPIKNPFYQAINVEIKLVPDANSDEVFNLIS